MSLYGCIFKLTCWTHFFLKCICVMEFLWLQHFFKTFLVSNILFIWVRTILIITKYFLPQHKIHEFHGTFFQHFKAFIFFLSKFIKTLIILTIFWIKQKGNFSFFCTQQVSFSCEFKVFFFFFVHMFCSFMFLPRTEKMYKYKTKKEYKIAIYF